MSHGHWIHYYIDRFENAPPIKPIPSYLQNVDNMLDGGFLPGQVVTVAAGTSHGKTSFALTCALSSAYAGIPVAIVSFEMTLFSIALRMAQMLTGIPASVIMRRSYSDSEKEKVSEANNILRELPILGTFAHGFAPDRFFELITEQVEQNNIGLLIIDYIQLVGSSDNRTSDVSRSMKGLMRLAGELNIPVLSLAQFNRNYLFREKKTPTLFDIKDSSSIEQNSEIVIILKPQIDKPWQSDSLIPYDITVAKNRNGQCGTVIESFSPSHVRFISQSEIFSRFSNVKSKKSDKYIVLE